MKRKIQAILCVTILVAALTTACSAGEASYGPGSSLGLYEESRNTGMRDTSTGGGNPAYDYAYPEADMDSPAYLGDSDGGGAGIVQVIAPVSGDLAEKIIFSYYAEIETLAFETTIGNVNSLIAEHGAFIERSDIKGINYSNSARGYVDFRSAYYAIRVPVGELNAVTSKLGMLGNIVNQSSNAENITAQFTDFESRLNSLRIQEERLLDMLSKAEDVADMLKIENSLSDIRYQIEHITSTLANWQRQVDYSTLTLSIVEVEEYMPVVTPSVPPPGYWEKMGKDFMETLRSVGGFFADVFMWFVVSAPVLIIFAVIAFIIIIIVKKQIRKNKARQKERQLRYANAPAVQNYYPPTPGGASPVAENTPVPPQEAVTEQENAQKEPSGEDSLKTEEK